MTPGEALRLLGGSATRKELLRHSTRWHLDHAVDTGQILRVGRGRYALPALADGLRIAVTQRGTLSHESAAQYWKLEAIATPNRVHITVPPNASRSPQRSVTFHYAEAGGLVTSPLRTVIDCARTLPFNEALAIADSALRRELIDRDDLIDAAERVRGAGRAQARKIARLADGRSANPFESALRAILIEARISGFEPQLLIKDEGSWRVDLGDSTRRIVLEADSFAYHGSRAALERDCRRYDDLVCRDWLVLRFAWEQVMFDQDWIQAIIEATCRLRGPKRGPNRRKSNPRARLAA